MIDDLILIAPSPAYSDAAIGLFGHMEFFWSSSADITSLLEIVRDDPGCVSCTTPQQFHVQVCMSREVTEY